MPESVLSRLARSTELSKTESRSAGAARIQSRRTRYKSESDCPRNLTTIPCCTKPCQREPFTEFPRDFHNRKDLKERTGEQKGSFQRKMVWPSASRRTFRRRPKRKTEN